MKYDATENMKGNALIWKSLCTALCCGLVLLFCQSFSGDRTKSHKGRKIVVNTTEIGKDVRGYRGPVPVSIHITGNIIDSIVPLPNGETPRFFQRVVQSGLFQSYRGKTLDEAACMKPDAVSGATYSSTAVISNINIGIKKAVADSKKNPVKSKKKK